MAGMNRRQFSLAVAAAPTTLITGCQSVPSSQPNPSDDVKKAIAKLDTELNGLSITIAYLQEGNWKDPQPLIKDVVGYDTIVNGAFNSLKKALGITDQ
jgi:hypothetical protein